MSKGASFHRGESRQDYETPPVFIDAVVKRFGPLSWDLAATAHNAKARLCFGYDPSGNFDDALTRPWPIDGPLCWLNPPFANIAPWAKKCAEESAKGCRILFLTPASVGSRWFADYVFGKALVIFLSGPNYRIRFVGAKYPYPKDCILSCFGLPPGFEIWRWRE
jgi:hypothetical protein